MKSVLKFVMLSALIMADIAVMSEPEAAEKVPPAFVPEQAQASAMAVPEPNAPAPVSVIVITVCNQIVAVAATDATGILHPLNIEGLGDARLKAILASFKQQLVVDTGCKVQPDKQPIF